MSFHEDLKKFLIAFLLGLAPVLLADTFIVDKLGTIFNLSSQSSFEIFKWLYFGTPILILLISFHVITHDSNLKSLRWSFVSFSVTLIPLFFLLYHNREVNVAVYYFFYLVFLGLNFWLGLRLAKKLKLKWILSYKRLIVEFVVLSGILILISLIYIENNAKKYQTKEKDENALMEIISSSEKAFEQMIKAGDSTIFDTRDYLLKNKRQKYGGLKEAAYNDVNEQWTDVVNYTVYKGIALLMLELAILLIYWFIYRIYNIYLFTQHQEGSAGIAEISEANNGYTVKKVNDYEDLEVLKLVRAMIVLLTVMITPIFYTTNSVKDIVSNPFINITNISKPTVPGPSTDEPDATAENPPIVPQDSVVTIQLSEAQFREILEEYANNDTAYTRKYLRAIWEDQKYYQQRFKNRTPSSDVISVKLPSNYPPPDNLDTPAHKR